MMVFACITRMRGYSVGGITGKLVSGVIGAYVLISRLFRRRCARRRWLLESTACLEAGNDPVIMLQRGLN